MNKERAIEIIKKIIKDNERIGLSLAGDGCASWKVNNEDITGTEWKYIGYVSAYAHAFNITSEDI